MGTSAINTVVAKGKFEGFFLPCPLKNNPPFGQPLCTEHMSALVLQFGRVPFWNKPNTLPHDHGMSVTYNSSHITTNMACIPPRLRSHPRQPLLPKTPPFPLHDRSVKRHPSLRSMPGPGQARSIGNLGGRPVRSRYSSPFSSTSANSICTLQLIFDRISSLSTSSSSTILWRFFFDSTHALTPLETMRSVVKSNTL